MNTMDKTLPDHLPEPQRQELTLIVERLVKTGLAETIFLYGSFARRLPRGQTHTINYM